MKTILTPADFSKSSKAASYGNLNEKMFNKSVSRETVPGVWAGQLGYFVVTVILSWLIANLLVAGIVLLF